MLFRSFFFFFFCVSQVCRHLGSLSAYFTHMHAYLHKKMKEIGYLDWPVWIEEEKRKSGGE